MNVVICIVSVAFLMTTRASIGDEPVWDNTGEKREPSIDEIINNAAIMAQMDQIANLAKNPGAIENYAQNDYEREGTVMIDNDMLFTAEQFANINFLDDETVTKKKRKKRKAIRWDRHRWPNNVVPYQLARGHFSSRDIQIINGAIREWERETCLDFKPASGAEKNKVMFQNGGGCSSYVGRIGGTQPLTLAPGCRVHGIVVHEMGHAIGFQHEQTRPDRDQFVTIHKDNIIARTLFNFRRFDWSSVVSHKVPYDYESVMHYGHYAFTRNGRKTITVKDSRFHGKIGNRRGLSFRDAKLANLIYKCAERNRCQRMKCPGEGFVNKHCQCRCPGRPTIACEATGTRKPEPVTKPRSTHRPRTPRPTGSCQDDSGYCRSWAVGNGCKLFYSTLSRKCRKTCNLCRNKPCIDKNRYCPTWKQQKFCNHIRYRTYMSISCQKSCGTCPSSAISESVSGPCDDKESLCKLWSTQGQCELTTKVDFMKTNCAYTCGYCTKR